MTTIVDSQGPTQTERLLAEFPFVHALARALVRDADAARDVAQDVMVAALQQRQPVQHWRRWLTSVTRRLAGAARRAGQRRSAVESRTARPEASDVEQRAADRIAMHRRLCDAVLALPEPYRTT